MENLIHKQNNHPLLLHKYTTDELLDSNSSKNSVNDVRNRINYIF